jgi:hypothetical protein
MLARSAATVERPRTEEEQAIDSSGPKAAIVDTLATSPISEVRQDATKSRLTLRRRPQKKRVHYTIDADLIAWAEEAYHDHRRADGTRLRSASEYVAELLRLARDR